MEPQLGLRLKVHRVVVELMSQTQTEVVEAEYRRQTLRIPMTAEEREVGKLFFKLGYSAAMKTVAETLKEGL